MKSKNYDIIFLSLARDCSSTINFFFNFLLELSNKGHKVLSIIGENGSQDYTFDEIRKFSDNNSELVTFLDTTFIEQFSDRIIRLSKARQFLKDYITKNKIECEYLCVIDVDNVLSKNFSTKDFYLIKNELDSRTEDTFAVSVKSKPFYYDILNFESYEFKNLNIMQIQNDRRFSTFFKRKKNIYDVQKALTVKDDFFSISSFNGMCLYKFNHFIQGNYYEENNNNPMPEHLNLNRRIHKITGKKILVSEKIELLMPVEHRPIFNLFNFIYQKFIKYILIYFRKLND
tara:strand:+ start:901 stop:1761 length:861 start_codon:yes stop_codon:yes gene_type:complete